MIRTGLSILALMLVYALVDESNIDEQQRAAEHKAETIAAAKVEFKRMQTWDELLQNTDLLSLPVQAAK